MAMYVAGQLEKADALLTGTLTNVPAPGNMATLCIGLIPIYFRAFQIDISKEEVSRAFGQFHVRTEAARHTQPTYAYEGLICKTQRDTAVLSRNGLVRTRSELTRQRNELFHVSAVDFLFRNFVFRAREFCTAVPMSGPFLLRAALVTPMRLIALMVEDIEGNGIEPGLYELGTMEVFNLNDPFEQLIKPFCDHAHQMFGEEGSPCFDADGHWQARF